jgi:DNA-binding transcriptional LysR family regulator
MDWDDARVLLELLRAGNLRAAGVRLALDTSTVSRRLARIEESLGARLFSRTRDGLRPTAAAERIRKHVETMEAELGSMVQSARAQETSVSGAVRVATTEALGRMLVTAGLLGVQREHPGVTIDLLAENRSVDLVHGEADVAVRLAALRQPSLRARCVARSRIGLFAAPSYLRTRGPVHGAALRGHDVLLPAGDLARLAEAKWLASQRGVRAVFRSNSMSALVAAAAAGHGIVPMPVGWGDSEPGLERVRILDVPERKVWLVTHDAVAGRPAVEVVAARIAAIFASFFGRRGGATDQR